jgi:phenylpropionate dioxygenase-like ring-hydroxylating dioxygenase large terminal subunit
MNKDTPWKENTEINASSVKPNPAMAGIRMDAARKVVELAKNGKTDLAPDVMHEDVSFYLDPDMYAREHRKLFLETPLVACLSKDLPEPGSFRVFDEVGVPIVLTRGKDGKVNAFLNICGHRGARLIRQDCGKANRFSCRFHGWTYDMTGKVVGVPDEQYFCGKIDEQKQLVAIPVEERHGLIFVQATPGSKMDLDAHLSGFGDVLEALDLSQATCVIEETFENPSNWKYTMETYMENYHLTVLHRETIGDVFARNLNVFDTWGPHHRFTWPHRTIHEWMKGPESEWPINGLPLTHFMFPNMHMAVGSVSPNGALIGIHRLFPKSVNEVVAKVTVYAPRGVQSAEHLEEIRKGYQLARRAVKDEDFSVTGESYGAFSKLPPGTKFPIGQHEIGVQFFHRNVRKFAGT